LHRQDDFSSWFCSHNKSSFSTVKSPSNRRGRAKRSESKNNTFSVGISNAEKHSLKEGMICLKCSIKNLVSVIKRRKSRYKNIRFLYLKILLKFGVWYIHII